MPGPAKRSNQHKKATMSRKQHTGEDLAPEIISAIPEVPPILSGRLEAIEEWNRICSLLVEQQILTEWDLPTVRIMCMEWQRYCDAVNDIETNGEFMVTKSGYEQVRPVHTIRNKAFGHYTTLLQRVGGDVVSRARMKRIKPVQEESNPFGSV